MDNNINFLSQNNITFARCQFGVDGLGLEKLYQHVDKQFEAHLKKIRVYLKQPSISADGTGMMETAEITKGFIEEIGGHGEIVSTD